MFCQANMAPEDDTSNDIGKLFCRLSLFSNALKKCLLRFVCELESQMQSSKEPQVPDPCSRCFTYQPPAVIRQSFSNLLAVYYHPPFYSGLEINMDIYKCLSSFLSIQIWHWKILVSCDEVATVLYERRVSEVCWRSRWFHMRHQTPFEDTILGRLIYLVYHCNERSPVLNAASQTWGF